MNTSGIYSDSFANIHCGQWSSQMFGHILEQFDYLRLNLHFPWLFLWIVPFFLWIFCHVWWLLAPCASSRGGLDHSQGKWFAPGEALPPGFIITAHPEGHTAPQEGHMMSDKARWHLLKHHVYLHMHGMCVYLYIYICIYIEYTIYTHTWYVHV